MLQENASSPILASSVLILRQCEWDPSHSAAGLIFSHRASFKEWTIFALRHAKIRLVTSRPLFFTLLSIALAYPLFGATTAADEMAGAVLFRDKGCEHCHGAGGVGTKKGPSLVDIRREKQWTPEKITQQILNGGKKMPPFADSLSDPEIAQIVAYLRAKHRPVPPPASGN